MFIVANDIYTREKVNLRQVLSHTWVECGLLLPLYIFMHWWEWQKKVQWIGYECSSKLYIKAMSIQCQEKALLSQKSFI